MRSSIHTNFSKFVLNFFNGASKQNKQCDIICPWKREAKIKGASKNYETHLVSNFVSSFCTISMIFT